MWTVCSSGSHDDGDAGLAGVIITILAGLLFIKGLKVNTINYRYSRLIIARTLLRILIPVVVRLGCEFWGDVCVSIDSIVIMT